MCRKIGFANFLFHLASLLPSDLREEAAIQVLILHFKCSTPCRWCPFILLGAYLQSYHTTLQDSGNQVTSSREQHFVAEKKLKQQRDMTHEEVEMSRVRELDPFSASFSPYSPSPKAAASSHWEISIPAHWRLLGQHSSCLPPLATSIW